MISSKLNNHETNLEIVMNKVYIIKVPHSYRTFAAVKEQNFSTFKLNACIKMLKEVRKQVDFEMRDEPKDERVCEEPHIFDDGKTAFGAKARIEVTLPNPNGFVFYKYFEEKLEYTCQELYTPGDVINI